MAKRGSAAWMTDCWGEAGCDALIVVPIYAGGPKCQVRQEARDAVIALGRVFQRYRYIVNTIGGYNKRPNTSNPNVWSNHSWGTAVDVNEATNPYNRTRLITDMSQAMIRDIEKIATVDGVQVWRSGYDWDGNPDTASPPYDAMHFEIVATQKELARGISATLPPKPKSKSLPVAAYPVIREGADGPAVRRLQQLLSISPADGKFGPITKVAVIGYQRTHGLDPDGVVGAATWASITAGLVAVESKGGESKSQ
jgi:peptidoglycan hydrolase-like protein with peptidoglycan-binding domain